jgi:hypothetical protein
MPRLKSAYIQFALAIAFAFLLSYLMHSDSFHSLIIGHSTVRTALACLTFPAVLFAFYVGGHGPSAFELTCGLVLEFTIIFLVFRLVVLGLSKLESSMT